MSIDLKALKLTPILKTVQSRLGSGKKSGLEYLFKCPFHDDKLASFSVNAEKNIAKCFACGWGGDSVDFLVNYGSTFKEAINELNGGLSISTGERLVNETVPSRVIWAQIVPQESPSSLAHYSLGNPDQYWTYRYPNGDIMGFILRWNTDTGKQLRQYIFATDGNKCEWRFQGFDKPRPLYNLDKIANDRDEKESLKTVMIVEGEKTADAATLLFERATVTTWQGGVGGVYCTDFSPLYGRKIILSPDNDISQKNKDGKIKPFHEQPGNKAMYEIYEILKPHCEVIMWLDAPNGSCDKWDWADSNMTPQEATKYARLSIKQVPLIRELDPVQEVEPVVEPKKIPDRFVNEYYRYLGYSGESGSNCHYFFRNLTSKIISLSASQMSTANIIQLAPINYWEKTYPASKGGLSMNMVINSLIRTSEEKGSFNIDHVRGRGVWIDNKDIVFHLGDRLLVNNVEQDLGVVNSKYLYERNDSITWEPIPPVPTKSAYGLLEIFEMINWERPINSYLAAGWCVVAPICGALNWRPHIWITGSAGSGKTWIMENIIRKIVGDCALVVEGSSTSEAGIRQALQKDARPVIYDEAEGEDKQAQYKIQQVLGLMRLASSSSGGNIIKGSANGNSKTYVIRSCFAFSSIAVQLQQQSDKSRVSVLSVKVDNSDDRETKFKKLIKKHHETITPEFIQGLQNRTIELLPIILKNAHTFSMASASELKSQRAGDQIGVLLAGAYSLVSSNEISYEDAVKWVSSKDWSEEKGLMDTNDEFMLIAHIAESMTIFDATGGKAERTIGELILIADWKATDSYVTPEQANSRLKQLGIKVVENGTLFSNTSKHLSKILENTAWAKNYNKILLRIEGAEKLDSVRFASGLQSRAVLIPKQFFN